MDNSSGISELKEYERLAQIRYEEEKKWIGDYKFIEYLEHDNTIKYTIEVYKKIIIIILSQILL